MISTFAKLIYYGVQRRPRLPLITVAVLTLLMVSVSLAREVSCKQYPDLVGSCFTFHGKLVVGNGTPSARILRLGTNRILGVSEGHKAYMPAELERRLSFDDVVYGDFVVCPFSRQKPGEMQFICIESASRLILERRVNQKPVQSRIPNVSGP